MRSANLANKVYIGIGIFTKNFENHPLHEVYVESAVFAPYLRLRVGIGVFSGDYVDVVYAIAGLLELLHSVLVAPSGLRHRSLAMARRRKDALAVHVKIGSVSVDAQFWNGLRARLEFFYYFRIRNSRRLVVDLPPSERLIEPRPRSAAVILHILERQVLHANLEWIAAAGDSKSHLHGIGRNLDEIVVVDPLALSGDAVGFEHRIYRRTDIRRIEPKIPHTPSLCVLKAHLRKEITSEPPFEFAP